ncbi:MAG: hypothetical protein H6732_17190 [Alphaproteobacteria bacterium]|nr:hypothetical protein [Alphaproteobacteria bacterium]
MSRTVLGSLSRVLLRAPLLLCLASPAWAGPPQVTAADGASVAVATSGSGELGLVVVLPPGGDAAGWEAIRTRLGTLGARVLTVQPRALAAAEGEPGAAQDVAAAIAWMKGQKTTSVAVLGALEGGNLALHAAAADPAIARVVVLSPRLSAEGLSITKDLAALGDRPLLLVTSAGDATGSRAAGMIAGKAPGAAPVLTRSAEGTGAELFARDPKLDGDVLAWLRGPGADPSKPAGTPATASDVGTLETTGTKYGN